jgi:hypothetical protein
MLQEEERMVRNVLMEKRKNLGTITWHEVQVGETWARSGWHVSQVGITWAGSGWHEIQVGET